MNISVSAEVQEMDKETRTQARKHARAHRDTREYRKGERERAL